MPFVETSLGSLFYQDAGSGPVMVFIGGLSASSSAWQPFQRRFSKDFRVICPDNPGVGKSIQPQQPYSLEQVADALADLLAVLDARDCFCVGHSMGGCIAMALAARHPVLVNKLVLANTMAQPRLQRKHHFEQLQASRRSMSPQAWMTQFYEQMITPERFTNEAFRKALIGFALQQAQTDESFFAQMDALLAFDGDNHLRAIAKEHIQVLLLSSQYDMLIPHQRTFEMQSYCPSWQKKLIPNAAHASYVENFPAFYAALATFGGK